MTWECNVNDIKDLGLDSRGFYLIWILADERIEKELEEEEKERTDMKLDLEFVHIA